MHNERKLGRNPGRPISCPHRPPCPGCPHFGRDGLAPRTAQRVEEMCLRTGVPDFTVLAGRGLGYRHRARLAVRAQRGSPKMGLFERHSHRVVDIPHCATHHPQINRAAAWLRDAMESTRVPLYDESRHTGLVRYVQLSVERPTQRVQVVLVANCEASSELKQLCEVLTSPAPAYLHSLVFNGHCARNNAILGPNWATLWGPPCLEDSVGETRVFYPPGAFSQANPHLFDELVGHVRGWVPKGRCVVELYSGVGGIGLGLVAASERVVFNEVAAASLSGLALGVEALPSAEQAKVQIVPGDATNALSLVTEDSCVIVDPPRKGLDVEVLNGLCERRPERLIYVSCGFDSFERDAQALVNAGYSISALRAAALFPFTDHVEVAACFDRGH